MIRFRNTLLLALPLAAGALLSACAAQPGTDSVFHARQIESARTPADHERLAQEYAQHEARARKSAAEQRELAAGYLRWGIAGRADAGASLASHCRRLAEQYERAAGEYAAIAALHRELAARAAN